MTNTTKICSKCPENGPQPIRNFRLYSPNSRGVRYRLSYCKTCVGRLKKFRSTSAGAQESQDARNSKVLREERIIAQYTGGVPFQYILEDNETSAAEIDRIRKRRSVPKRSRRVYDVNDTFFESIDTEEKAYWLGFFSADGNIHRKVLSLSLAGVDRAHLTKFQRAIQHTGHLRFRDVGKAGAYVLGFTSEPMIADLARYGVGPAKSLTLLPTTVPNKLLSHYWRGFVDGDGWVWARDIPRRDKGEIGLCGTLPVVQAFVEFVVGLGVSSILTIHSRNEGRLYFVKTTKADSLRIIIDALYKDSSVFLDRKKEKSDEILRLLS